MVTRRTFLLVGVVLPAAACMAGRTTAAVVPATAVNLASVTLAISGMT